jgi:hypothetical protein
MKLLTELFSEQTTLQLKLSCDKRALNITVIAQSQHLHVRTHAGTHTMENLLLLSCHGLSPRSSPFRLLIRQAKVKQVRGASIASTAFIGRTPVVKKKKNTFTCMFITACWLIYSDRSNKTKDHFFYSVNNITQYTSTRQPNFPARVYVCHTFDEARDR